MGYLLLPSAVGSDKAAAVARNILRVQTEQALPANIHDRVDVKTQRC